MDDILSSFLYDADKPQKGRVKPLDQVTEARDDKYLLCVILKSAYEILGHSWLRNRPLIIVQKLRRT